MIARAALATLLVTLAACGSADDGPFDGTLDCDQVWSAVIEVDPQAEASVTPFDAMLEWAGGTYPDAEWSIHVVTARTGTVVIDEQEIALITVEELPTETFAAVGAEGCDGYEP